MSDRSDKFFLIAEGEVKAFVEKGEKGEEGSAGWAEEEMVKHYRTGEYFGELALLTSAPRRATIRNSKEDGQTLLLYLTRRDFEATMGSMRELILRSAAFRPAQKAQEQERRLVLGLSGSLRPTVLYLSLGTAFYTYTGFEELPGPTSPFIAFYFSVETALAVGFGVLTPRGGACGTTVDVTTGDTHPGNGLVKAVGIALKHLALDVGVGDVFTSQTLPEDQVWKPIGRIRCQEPSDFSAFFTAGFVISGAAILVNFLSGVVADLLEERLHHHGGWPLGVAMSSLLRLLRGGWSIGCHGKERKLSEQKFVSFICFLSGNTHDA
eukprot:Skav222505  [mRNA]  locus=scaffold1835:833572:846552:- [translate_table: standard]